METFVAESKGADSVPPNYRRTIFYRLTVWYVRLMPLVLVCFLVWPSVWFLLPAVIVFGLIASLPLRYVAHFEWGLSTGDLHEAILRDAVNIRYG